ncbi:MAG: aspartate/glutamate racemase family protein [bacterium]|nr:aspartate/glutamate racemase family protein [bacterium]
MIGVFDSGFGGLTIHRALIDALPEQDFVYLGDNKNAPYGTRPPIEVLTLTCAGLEALFAQGATLVIVACNTASVVALRWIQQQWLPVRMKQDGIKRNAIGIVVPTIEAATGVSWHDAAKEEGGGTIAVFATARTVDTGNYPFEISKRRPDIRVVQQACPELAGAIEAGAPREALRAMVQKFVKELEDRELGGHAPSSVILGCTHYPLVADLFAEQLPAGVPIIHQPEATAAALKGYLQKHPEYNVTSGGKRVFLSTGYSAEALPLIEKFWGGKLAFETV